MRILFVTPYVPSLIRVRPFQLIKALSLQHEVSLVALVCDEYERELLKEIANWCVSVDAVSLPRMRAYSNCLRALPTTMPLRVAYYRSPAFIRSIQRVIRERSIEVIHGELIKVMPALHAVIARENVPVLYDSVDCISWYLQQQHNSARNPLRKSFISAELQKMRRYEPSALHQLEKVVITSPRDREVLISLGALAERIHVVQNGVDTRYFAPTSAPDSQSPEGLVFCAKMDYAPNSQAILDFCREVLPRLWGRHPQVRLTIVGSNPPASVWALQADPRITVTGFVPDIRPYLARAAVALAPLRVAAGMQNKVLEAMAMGAPLVATPGSCRALQVQDGQHLLLAEEPEAMTSAIERLLTDPQQAHALGQAGRMYVEEHHSWSTAAQQLQALYQELQQARLHPLYTQEDVALIS